jgi:enoyl-CoA hydratase
MTEPTVLTQIDEPIGRLILNRPSKLNAITPQMRVDFLAALEELLAAEEVRVIVVQGAGRSFSAGYDLNPGVNMQENGTERRVRPTVATDLNWVNGEGEAWSRLWTCIKPTIAQVHGHCLAGSLNLAMECDIVVAANDATFGQPEARAIGLVPDQALWPLTIGLRKTKELLFTADLIDGRSAHELGMINHAVPADELEGFVDGLARRIAKTSTEMLAIQKFSVNAAATAMGIDGIRSSGVTYDVMAHLSKTARDWRRVVREQGVREGLKVLKGA